MPRALSSRYTPLLKFALPPIWIAIAVYAGWRLWSNPSTVLDGGEAGAVTIAVKWLLLALIALSLVVLFAFVVPLKRVELTPEGVRISNYIRVVTVPFNAIAGVRQNWLPTFRLVTLELRADAGFGRRVSFRPAVRQRMAFWRREYRREDELVGELRQLAGLPSDSRDSRLAL